MADLWDLVWGKPYVDPEALAAAIDAEAARDGLTYRERLLIRDAAVALEGYWGERWRRRLAGCPARERIERILHESFQEVGYPDFKERLMSPMMTAVEQYLRELSLHVRVPTRLVIGGSIALLLS